MLALGDLLELGARARIRIPVVSSQSWILLIKWHLTITIMRSSLLFNYILLVATNPLCSNPSTCFLRLTGTRKCVSCPTVKIYITYAWPDISFYLLWPWKSWTHMHACGLSSETANTHLLIQRFRCGLNFVISWDFSKATHTRRVECLQDRGFWDYIPLTSCKNVVSLKMFPAPRGSAVLRPDSLPTSLWFCTRDTLASILLNHSPLEWADATSRKTCYFWSW